jgi:hypothetical protein
MMLLRVILSLFVALNHGNRRVITVAFPSIQQKLVNLRQSSKIDNPSNGKWRHQLHQQYVTADPSHTDATTILGRYSRYVDEKPLIVKSITAGIVTMMANLFSQVILPRLQPNSSMLKVAISWRHVGMFMITGLFFIGPYLHLWYGLLDRIFAMPRQRNVTRTVVKVLINETIGLCIFFPLYFISLEIAESLIIGRGKKMNQLSIH